jgi:hypothetical protein
VSRRLVLLLMALALVLTGSLLAWPQLRGRWLLERSQARILDVFPTPLDDGTVRLSIAYEYVVPEAPGGHSSTSQIGWQIGDAFFRPMPDPVVARDRVDEVTRRLLDSDHEGVRMRPVYFLPNDPEGGAFILDETAEVPSKRLQIGAVLVGIGLLIGFQGLRRGTHL